MAPQPSIWPVATSKSVGNSFESTSVVFMAMGSWRYRRATWRLTLPVFLLSWCHHGASSNTKRTKSSQKAKRQVWSFLDLIAALPAGTNETPFWYA